MKEVILLAAYLNRQSEYFSLTLMTNESLKSLRTFLFTKECPGGEFLRNIMLHNEHTTKATAQS